MARRWSPSEDARLRDLYAAGVSVSAIAAELGRSDDAVVSRRCVLDVPSRRRRRPWSELEDSLLRLVHERNVPATRIAARLGRSAGDVRIRRRELGLPTRAAAARYSAQDDLLLREGIAEGSSIEALSELLGRSRGAVLAHVNALGLRERRPRRRWSTFEDALLRDGYTEGLRCQEIARSLPGRSTGGVAARARRLELGTYARRWSAAEERRLSALIAHRLPPQKIARTLGRTPEAVRRRARGLGLPIAAPHFKRSRWTAQEDSLLRLWPTLNPAILSEQLERSDQAIARRIRALGLRERRYRSPHHPMSSRAESRHPSAGSNGGRPGVAGRAPARRSSFSEHPVSVPASR